jgi:hypothetical protein
MNANELACLLSDAMNSNQRSGDLISLSHVLIPDHWLPALPELPESKGKPSLLIEERVLTWFHQIGFYGRLTTKNVGGLPDMLQELFAPPPWIRVEAEDKEDHLSEDHKREKLYLHCEQYGLELINTYKDYLEAQQEGPDLTQAFEEESRTTQIYRSLVDLRVKIDFVHILGRQVIDSLHQVMLEVSLPEQSAERPSAQSSTPSLLIWHRDPSQKLWFLAETLSSHSQMNSNKWNWIQVHWDDIRGHIVLLAIDGTA